MARVKNDSNDYVIRVSASLAEVDASQWNALLARQQLPSPFMRHEYLSAMQTSKSATPKSGWTPRVLTLHDGDELLGACVLYLKAHSYGEYVFDWAWANAYEQHGLSYYPKAIIAVPFTPVPGSRVIATSADDRSLLIQAAIAWCSQEKISSLHLLFGDEQDIAAATDAGMMVRHAVQFHWTNEGWPTFDAFLASLAQDKRKKIRQERRKVVDAGVAFRWARGKDISESDWDFFYSCYERTYLEHGNAPYLTRDFFGRMASDMAENWVLFVAERDGKPIASSLIAVDEQPNAKVAYGRYWGALERVDCLHFEACYYQPLQWCVEHGFDRFEGGAQGEHKMARALMPTRTSSAHWLAEPSFADAVERFLEREGQGIDNYLEHLEHRTPFRKPG